MLTRDDGVRKQLARDDGVRKQLTRDDGVRKQLTHGYLMNKELTCDTFSGLVIARKAKPDVAIQLFD